jgi:hypothetical protein
MSRRRAYIPLKVQLAAALCQIGKIDPEHAKAMTVDQVLSLFDLHHWRIPHALGGPDLHWNLEFQFRNGHRADTAKRDIPEIAKSKRISRDWQDHKQFIAAKAGRAEKPERKPSRVKSRGMPKPPPGAKFDWKKGHYVMPSTRAAE